LGDLAVVSGHVSSRELLLGAEEPLRGFSRLFWLFVGNVPCPCPPFRPSNLIPLVCDADGVSAYLSWSNCKKVEWAVELETLC